MAAKCVLATFTPTGQGQAIAMGYSADSVCLYESAETAVGIKRALRDNKTGQLLHTRTATSFVLSINNHRILGQ